MSEQGRGNAAPPIGSTDDIDLDKLVMNFLVVEGYVRSKGGQLVLKSNCCVYTHSHTVRSVQRSHQHCTHEADSHERGAQVEHDLLLVFFVPAFYTLCFSATFDVTFS